MFGLRIDLRIYSILVVDDFEGFPPFVGKGECFDVTTFERRRIG